MLFYFSASCEPLPALSDGRVHNNGINHGTLVTFSCEKGFQLKGSQQIICMDGKWNASSPACKGFSNYLIFHKADPYTYPIPPCPPYDGYLRLLKLTQLWFLFVCFFFYDKELTLGTSLSHIVSS